MIEQQGISASAGTTKPTPIPENPMNENEVMIDDVQEMMRIVGLSDHARPISCHKNLSI